MRQAEENSGRLSRFEGKSRKNFNPSIPPPSKNVTPPAPVDILPSSRLGSSRTRKLPQKFTPDPSPTPSTRKPKKTFATPKNNAKKKKFALPKKVVASLSSVPRAPLSEIVDVDLDDEIIRIITPSAPSPEKTVPQISPESQVQQETTEIVEQEERLFEDNPLGRLPYGVRDLDRWKGIDHPSWGRSILLPPLQWNSFLAKTYTADHITPWLDAMSIGVLHRVKHFVTMKDLKFMHTIAWLMASKKMRCQVYKGHGGIQGGSGRNYWTEAMTVFKGGDGVGYFAQQRTSITHRGFCIMEGFAEFSVVPYSVIQTVDSATPERRRMGNVEELCPFFAIKFPGEETLKNEDQRTLWNPIIGIGEHEGDKDNRDRGIARYASTL